MLAVLMFLNKYCLNQKNPMPTSIMGYTKTVNTKHKKQKTQNSKYKSHKVQTQIKKQNSEGPYTKHNVTYKLP